MLVYEKDNKLNINFENSVNESPDLSIGKSGDKTQILVDGQESGGGSSVFVVNIAKKSDDSSTIALDKTWKEIHDAIVSGTPVYMKGTHVWGSDTQECFWPICGTSAQPNSDLYGVSFPIDSNNGGPFGVSYFQTTSENGYPEYEPQ